MIYCLNPACPHPKNPSGNVHCQYCGVPIALRNRFKARRLLGQGGFGKTYLAEDLDNRNKPCVVKRLTYQGPDAQSTEKARRLFEQEAERLDQLVHPQIPRLLAYFQEGSYLYLVQEVIVGQTLEEELYAEGPFSEAKIRTVLTGLLPILQFVHSRSVIHRDIKPDNIMRRRNGELILIDFGVAKFLEQSGFSNAGTTIGTPGYAAPEQIQGRVTPASDLFALGATCFQLVSQCFDTDEISLSGYGWVKQWRKHVKVALSDKMVAILTRLMAVDDRQRYRTAAAVLQDLSSPGPSVVPASMGHNGPAVPPSQPPTVSGPPGMAPGMAPKLTNSPPGPPAANSPGFPPPKSPAVNPPVASPFVANPSVANPPPVSSVPMGFMSQPSGPQPPSRPSAPTDLSLKVGSLTAATRKVAVSASFWLHYGLFTYVGNALGFLVAMVVAAGLSSFGVISSDTEVALELVYWMHWLVAGFFVGVSQWLAIKRWLPRALWWLPATVAGFWMIALAVATGYADPFTGVAVGLGVGLPQWAAMRQQAPRAGWWVLWTMLFTALLCRAMSTNLVETTAWFLVVPLLDGLFLSWILRVQTVDPVGV